MYCILDEKQQTKNLIYKLRAPVPDDWLFVWELQEETCFETKDTWAHFRPCLLLKPYWCCWSPAKEFKIPYSCHFLLIILYTVIGRLNISSFSCNSRNRAPISLSFIYSIPFLCVCVPFYSFRKKGIPLHIFTTETGQSINYHHHHLYLYIYFTFDCVFCSVSFHFDRSFAFLCLISRFLRLFVES